MKKSLNLDWIIGSALLVLLVFVVDTIVAPKNAVLGQGIAATFYSFLIWSQNELTVDVLYTISRVILGFFIAVFFGIIIGLSTGRYANMSKSVSGIFNYLRAITPVALAPFFLIALGINEWSKILLISWGAFFPIWISAHLGIKSLPRDLITSTKLLGLSRWQILRHFYFPATFNAAYPGMRIAIGLSFILVFISEALGASQGVGFRLGVAYDTLQTAYMMSALLLLGILGWIADRMFVATLSYLTPWISFEKNNETASK